MRRHVDGVARRVAAYDADATATTRKIAGARGRATARATARIARTTAMRAR